MASSAAGAVGGSAVLARVGRGILAAAVPGVVSGVITRLLMRAVAVTVHNTTHFTLAVSLGIPMIYTVALLPGCLALSLARRSWPWLLFAAGVGLLVFEAVSIGLDETRSAHDLGAGHWALLVALLTAMGVVYTVQFGWAARWARRGPRAVRRR